MSRASGFWNVCKKIAKNHFILVQSVRSGVLISTGDLIAQTVIEKRSREDVDLCRTARFFTIGTLLLGPGVSVWYNLILPKFFGVSGKMAALKKIAADQILFAPYTHAVLIVSVNFLEKRNWELIKEQLRLKYTDILLTSYKFWPAVHLINFNLVPLNYQVLVVQCVGLCWNTFLCWKTHQVVKK
ncbi:hypothetical protein JTB14_004007 [Gonioctena quinquepunctata]|nr:hypothetical protein JTB14_004007 [Gonioctena quinquepunctata]